MRLRAALTVMALGLAAGAGAAGAEALKITSDPPGANVEINGSFAGQTPFTVDYPGVYFHKPHTAFGDRLEHAVLVRVSKTGFVPRQLTVSDGPFKWVGFTGKQHGTYFVIRADHFEVKLDAMDAASEAPLGDGEHAGPLRAPRHSVQPVADVLADTGSVVVSTEPSGADIYIDGSFAGQTPSTLHLAGGSHRVELRAEGRSAWVRELQITNGSSVSIHPALAASAASSP